MQQDQIVVYVRTDHGIDQNVLNIYMDMVSMPFSLIET